MLLVEQGANKDETFGNLDMTALCAAAANDHLDVLRYLVEQGADMEKADNGGWMPLLYASRCGNYELVRYLLEQGANREKADNVGMTSLHLAALHGHLAIAKLLMVYGADLNARDRFGKLPIDVASNEEIKQAIRDEPRRRIDAAPGKRCTEHDRPPDAAVLTSSPQKQNEEKQIMKQPAGGEEVEDIFAVLRIQNTMMTLYDAASDGNLKCVTLLVEEGAEKDETFEDRRMTALCIAAEKGHLDVARYLVEQGANIEKADRYGWTPLMFASFDGGIEVTRYLLEQGAERDKADSTYGLTSLHIAAQQGYLEITKLLMVYGADLNTRNSEGVCPIDFTSNQEIKQAIRDEPRRRMDHGHKRATEQDTNASMSASAQQEIKAPGEEDQNNQEPRKEEAKDGIVADEDQDSEPSDDEDGH